MTDNCTGHGVITDILDALDRRGYARSDNSHTAGAILLIGDLAHIYEGSQDHLFSPYLSEPPFATEPVPSRPADRDIVVLSASVLSAVVAALDDATLYKRDRVVACADCADQSCGTCRWRLQVAETYASLAAQLAETAQASRAVAASNPGPTSRPQPAEDREIGQ
jgi:hypothetical protein